MEHQIFRVEYRPTKALSFQLVVERQNEMALFAKFDKVLMVGDRVIFRVR